jgi:hypothetical protein
MAERQRHPGIGTRSRDRQQGYVFITTALLLAVVLGMTGLAFDIGRMYVARSEAQTSADALALKAASLLDGTQSGVSRAKQALADNPNRFHFGVQSFEDAELGFSQSQDGPWESHPMDARSLRFARVLMKAPVPIYLLRVTGAPGVGNTSAVAIAGHVPKSRFGIGLFPYSPIAPNPDDAADFGFERGKKYALSWEPGKLGTGSVRSPAGSQSVIGGACDGDATAPDRRAEKVTGYFGPPAPDPRRRAILGDLHPEEFVAKVGEPLPIPPEERVTVEVHAKGFAQRVQSDSDSGSATFTQYQSVWDGAGQRVGNGRRIVGVPVRSGGAESKIVGFRAFFLLPAEWYAGSPSSLCAEYIGSWTLGATQASVRPSNSYVLRLVQ